MSDIRQGSSRREFLKNTGRSGRGLGAGGRRRAARPRRGEQHDPGGADRLRRPRHRRGGERPLDQERPDQARGHGRRVRGPAEEQLRRTSKKQFADKVDVPEDRKFVGFDAYKKAMDCLKPGDVAIFATPPAFRWVHFTYAIEKGLNVFMEKPVTVDGPTTRQDARAGRGGGEEEPQGRRRPDVPPLPRPPANCYERIQRRRDRRHHRHAGLSHGAARRSASPARSRTASASCCTRSSGSTASSGPAAACSATSTSTTSTSAAG